MQITDYIFRERYSYDNAGVHYYKPSNDVNEFIALLKKGKHVNVQIHSTSTHQMENQNKRCWFMQTVVPGNYYIIYHIRVTELPNDTTN